MKKSLLFPILVTSALLFASGCACAPTNTSSETTSEETTSSISVDPKLIVTVNFYIDCNAIVYDDVYYVVVVKNGDKLPKPANPTTAPSSDYPNFKGWSTHEVVDDMKYLWNFEEDVVQSEETTMNMFGIWTA